MFFINLLKFVSFFLETVWIILSSYKSAFWEYLFLCFLFFICIVCFIFSDLKKKYLEIKISNPNILNKIFIIFVLCVVICFVYVLVFFLNQFLDVAESVLIDIIKEQENAISRLTLKIEDSKDYLLKCDRVVDDYHDYFSSKKK